VTTKAKPKSNPWGNPETSSFHKTYIRQINFEGASAEVHREILDIAVEVLHLAKEQGTLPAGPLVSFDKHATQGPTAFGAALGIYGGVEGAEEWGFAEDEKLGLVFKGDIERAKELTLLAQERFVARQAFIEQPPTEPEKWAHIFPGQRDLAIGSRGQDVQFIQVLLEASDQGGVFDAATEAAVRRLQQRLGTEETGIVDAAVWRAIYPTNRTFSVGRGEGGFHVRVAQAALVVYADEDIAITGRYGVDTDKAVRRVQLDKGLRINGYMRIPEWVAVLGPREDWPSL
jgi:peptidoglycan hydrolase-like protein with peptidoglycan-binding domain